MEGGTISSSNRTSTTQTTTPGGAQLTPQSVESAAAKHKNDSIAMEFQIEENEEEEKNDEGDVDMDEPLQHEIVYDKDDILKQILTGIGGDLDPDKEQQDKFDGSIEETEMGEEAVKATILRMRNSGALIQFPQDEFQPIIRSESKAALGLSPNLDGQKGT